jgi:putative oxidoreductase
VYNIINIAFLIGRIIAGGFFLTSGINHLAKLSMMAGYAKSKGMPAPELAVGGTGALLILGGATLLVICLLGFSFRIHNYWAIQDPQAKQAEEVNFMKNMALLGLLLMTLMIPRPWPMSLGR